MCLLSFYLLTYTPRINSSDGLAMFATAESLVRRGGLDIEQIRWMDLQQGTYGLDGLLYSRKGIGVPLALLPLTWLGLWAPGIGLVGTSLLFNPLVTALTAVLVAAYLQSLGFSHKTGVIAALTFGLATLAWPYAKSLFSDSFSGLLLLAAAYSLLKVDREEARQLTSTPSPAPRWPTRLGYPFLAGLLLGWNVATRYAEVLFVPLFGLLLLYYLHRHLPSPKPLTFLSYLRLFIKRFWPVLLAFSLPILMAGLGLIAFNLSRYGDPFNTGYLPEETFGGVLWEGIIGQLLSPGRGLFLYSPILLLSLWGIIPFYRQFRAETGVAFSIILIHLLLYGQWFMWHGGYAWGPRFMIPTLPFWVLFLAPVIAQGWPVQKEPTSRRDAAPFIRAVYLTLFAISLIPQILSVILDFAPFQNWLLESGQPLFARETFFSLHYSPFLRAWAFIEPATLDLAWAWQGQFNGWLLLILLVNVMITIFFLIQAFQASSQPGHPYRLSNPTSQLLPYGSTLAAVVFLLWHSHYLLPSPLQTIVNLLNEGSRPGDAIILNDPDITTAFAERYKGRAPVLGLNKGGFPLPDDIEGRLNQIMANHKQVWWLPNWLPPEESAVEQVLLSKGFRSRQEMIEGRRLVLFAFPPSLTIRPSLNLQFEKSIQLKQVAYPAATQPGEALPVELHWRAGALLKENYHVFIHLLGEEGQLIAQADGQPAQWTRPTSTWAAGETVVDRHGLWLPADTPPGSYQLLVGLYRPADGQRLHLADGDDVIKLPVAVE